MITLIRGPPFLPRFNRDAAFGRLPIAVAREPAGRDLLTEAITAPKETVGYHANGNGHHTPLPTPRISVIIPTLRGRPHLHECLSTLLAQDFAEPFEVLLVDNASEDDSGSFVEASFPSVRVIRNASNKGYASACNRGAAQALGSYLVFLNDDVRLPPDWLRRMVLTADEAPNDVFAVGSAIRLYSSPDRLNHFGARFTPIGGGYDYLLGANVTEAPQVLSPFNTASACGAGALYRRKIFESLGGLDERFFMYFEDVDIAWRGWLRGYRVWLEPRAIMYHKFGATTGNHVAPMRIYWGILNQFRTLLQHRSLFAIFVGLPLIFITTVARLVSHLENGQTEAAKAMLRALRDLFADFDVIREHRKKNRKLRARSDGQLRAAGLLATYRDLFAEFRRVQALRKEGIEI